MSRQEFRYHRGPVPRALAGSGALLVVVGLSVFDGWWADDPRAGVGVSGVSGLAAGSRVEMEMGDVEGAEAVGVEEAYAVTGHRGRFSEAAMQRIEPPVGFDVRGGVSGAGVKGRGRGQVWVRRWGR